MKILVSAASKHGATAEIALVIGETLRGDGVDAEVLAPDEVRSLDGFDGVILGSGVYAGHWLEPAKRLVADRAAALRALPVWLFSSGPVGDPLKPDDPPVDVAALVETTHARDARVFGGRIDRTRLGFAERAIVAALRVPEGDFRPWPDIRAWTLAIAAELRRLHGLSDQAAAAVAVAR